MDGLTSVTDCLPTLNENDGLVCDHGHRTLRLRLVLKVSLLKAGVPIGDVARRLARRPAVASGEGEPEKGEMG